MRTEVIQGYQQAAAEEYMEVPENESAYRHVSSSVQRFCEFIEKRPFAVTSLLKMQSADVSITHHSVNVAALTLALAANSRFKDSSKLHVLALDACSMT